MKKKIVIVDDHDLIAQALTEMVDHFQNFEVIYSCNHGKWLEEKFLNPKFIPDIVLLDISMPIKNGFETALWLKENYPNVLILALSMQGEDKSVIKMVKNGAHGYLLKNTSPSELNKALEKIVSDGYYYPQWVAKIIYSNINNENSNTVQISLREQEFLNYTVTEMSYKEIADKMCCSPRTVENYRDSLFEKLDLKTRVGLAMYAVKNSIA
jgi:DNA-binding NarL/FixJ family response regulator